MRELDDGCLISLVMAIIITLVLVLGFVAINPFSWGWLKGSSTCGTQSNPCYYPMPVPMYHPYTIPMNPPEDIPEDG